MVIPAERASDSDFSRGYGCEVRLRGLAQACHSERRGQSNARPPQSRNLPAATFIAERKREIPRLHFATLRFARNDRALKTTGYEVQAP